MSDANDRPATIQVPAMPLLVAVLALVLLPAAAVIVASGGMKGSLVAKADPESPEKKAGPEEKKGTEKGAKKGVPAPPAQSPMPALVCLRAWSPTPLSGFEPAYGSYLEFLTWQAAVHSRIAGAGDITLTRGPAVEPVPQKFMEAAKTARADFVLAEALKYDGSSPEAHVKFLLADGASGKTLWSREFRLGTDPVATRALRDEVIREVGSAVRRAMGLPPASAATPDTPQLAQEVLKLLRPELEKLAPPKADAAAFAKEVLTLLRPEVARMAVPPPKANRLPSLLFLQTRAGVTGVKADIVAVRSNEIASEFASGAVVALLRGPVTPGSLAEIAALARKEPVDFALGQATTFHGAAGAIGWNFKLVEAATGKVIWSRESFVSNGDDAAGVVREVVAAVKRAVVVPAPTPPDPDKSAVAREVLKLLQPELTKLAPINKAADALAVLPFKSDASVKEAVARWADEIPESLLKGAEARLVPAARVKALGDAVAPLDAGKRLSVRLVLTGEVKDDGKSLTIAARLIETDTDLVLWADRWKTEDLKEKAAFLDKVRGEIAARVEKRLAGLKRGKTP